MIVYAHLQVHMVTLVLFRLGVSEMSEKISLKKGVKFVISLNMGENVCRVLYLSRYNSDKIELKSI